jgi:hypothetical protein
MKLMGTTSNIYVSFGLTVLFDHLFNENSSLCIVPHNYLNNK